MADFVNNNPVFAGILCGLLAIIVVRIFGVIFSKIKPPVIGDLHITRDGYVYVEFYDEEFLKLNNKDATFRVIHDDRSVE